MDSLVANYGSSSGTSSDSDSDIENGNDRFCDKTTEVSKLPRPDFMTSVSSVGKCSVFSNTFTQAEDAKKAILEKHVKMVPTKDNTRVINGKRICWNYRKGRCRFGHKCKYAHDSDVHKTKEELEEQNKIQSTIICQSNDVSESTLEPSADSVETISKNQQRKKRPGLSQTLVPTKKVMKFYKATQGKGC